MTTQCESDLLSGVLSHVATIAKQRTGKRPSGATVWRWVKRGLRGGTIRLQAVYVSGYWATTPEAFDAFLNAQTQAALQEDCGDCNGNPTDDSLRAIGLMD